MLSGETKQLRFTVSAVSLPSFAVYGRIAEKVEPNEMLGERLNEAEVKELLQAAV